MATLPIAFQNHATNIMVEPNPKTKSPYWKLLKRLTEKVMNPIMWVCEQNVENVGNASMHAPHMKDHKEINIMDFFWMLGKINISWPIWE